MDNERRASVRLSQLRLYVDNHYNDKYLAPPLTVVVAALLTVWTPMWQVALWAVIELGIIAFYIDVYSRFRREDPTPADEPAWARRIARAHGAHMLSWSSIVVWAWQPGNFNSLMFTMLIHVGLISLTVVMSNPHRRLLFTDLIAPTVALVAPPLLGEGYFNLGLSVLGFLYVALMLQVGLKIHENTTEALLLRQRNEELIRELELQATRDPLTGVSNRRHFLAVGAAELQRASRAGHPLALVMLDIDHFKPINDGYGHLAGDEVLKAVVCACSRLLRGGDCLGRLGGEEFAIILPETNLAQALGAAERLRQEVAGLRFAMPGGAPVVLTVSIGVAMQRGPDETMRTLMHRADLAMYAAKSQGRDRVVTHETPGAAVAGGSHAKEALPQVRPA